MTPTPKKNCGKCHERSRRVDYHWRCVNCDGQNFAPKNPVSDNKPLSLRIAEGWRDETVIFWDNLPKWAKEVEALEAEVKALTTLNSELAKACDSWEGLHRKDLRDFAELGERLAKAQELLEKKCEYCKLNGCDVATQCPVCLVPQAKAALGGVGASL